MTNEVRQKILNQIQELELQLNKISEQIEVERFEESEDDSAIKQELLDKKEFTEQQIAELQEALQTGNAGKIKGYGDVYNIEINGAKRTLTLVHQAEADPASGKISIESPLAQALIGRKTGDQVNVETPAGLQTYKII